MTAVLEGGEWSAARPRPHFTAGKDPVPILQEAGWAPGPVRTGGKSLPHRDSIPDRPARSQSLYRLSYRTHGDYLVQFKINESHHHHHISVMDLGHLLTRSGLTYPEVSSMIYRDSFCQSDSSVSLFWVISFEAFYLHVVSFIPLICPKLMFFFNSLAICAFVL